MFHHKASIQVEYRYVPLVPVKPCPVLWKTDVYQLEDKLQRHKQAERERQEFMLLGHTYNPGKMWQRQTDRQGQTGRQEQ